MNKKKNTIICSRFTKFVHIKLTRVRYHTDSLIGGVLGRIHSSSGASRLNCQCPLCASRYVMKKRLFISWCFDLKHPVGWIANFPFSTLERLVTQQKTESKLLLWNKAHTFQNRLRCTTNKFWLKGPLRRMILIFRTSSRWKRPFFSLRTLILEF